MNTLSHRWCGDGDFGGGMRRAERVAPGKGKKLVLSVCNK